MSTDAQRVGELLTGIREAEESIRIKQLEILKLETQRDGFDYEMNHIIRAAEHDATMSAADWQRLVGGREAEVSRAVSRHIRKSGYVPFGR